jgi:hypothetical protein
MALPGNVLSTDTSHDDFISPRDVPKTLIQDYEIGGVALADPSQGLNVKTWRAFIDDAGTTIKLEATGVLTTTQITGTEITEVSLSFDQNMRPVIAFVDSGVAKFRWFDSLVSNFVTTTLTSAKNPRVCLDDKRAQTLGSSDVILAYLLADALVMRMQRDRYTVAYELDDEIEDRDLLQIGMNKRNRFQFQLQVSP